MARIELILDVILDKARKTVASLKQELSKFTLTPEVNTSAVEQASNSFKKLKQSAAEAATASSEVGEKTKKAGKEAQKHIEEATKQAEAFAKSLKSAAMTAMGGFGAIKLAELFGGLDTATARIKTLGGEAAKLAPTLQTMALQMSKTIPISAIEIQQAAYDALSAGIEASEASMQTFMDTASKLAVGGMESIGNTVNILSSLLNAYGESADKASRYSDILFNTVNLGKTTIPELTASLSQVVPSASEAGVALEYVGSALALMTANGIPTTQAATKLNQLLVEMKKPGGEFAKVMQSAGVSLESLRKEGLVVTLEKLKNTMQAMGKQAGSVFGSAEAAAAFAVLTKDVEKFKSVFEGVQGTTGTTARAFEEMQNSVSNQFKQLLLSLETFFLETTSKLLPTIQSAIEFLKSSVEAIIFVFKNFGTIILGTVAAVKAYQITLALTNSSVGVAIKGILGLTAATQGQTVATRAATMATQAFKAAWATNPIGLILAGVTTAVSAIMFLSNALKQNAEDKLANAKAAGELIEKQINETKSTLELKQAKKALIDEYLDLANKSKLSIDEQKRFSAIQEELKTKYPALIDNTKTYAEQLIYLKQASEQTANEIGSLTNKLNRLNEQQKENLLRTTILETDLAMGKLKEQADELLSFFEKMQRGKGIVMGLFKSVVEDYRWQLEKAKTKEEFDRLSAELQAILLGDTRMFNKALSEYLAKTGQSNIYSAKSISESFAEIVKNEEQVVLKMKQAGDELIGNIEKRKRIIGIFKDDMAGAQKQETNNTNAIEDNTTKTKDNTTATKDRAEAQRKLARELERAYELEKNELLLSQKSAEINLNRAKTIAEQRAEIEALLLVEEKYLGKVKQANISSEDKDKLINKLQNNIVNYRLQLKNLADDIIKLNALKLKNIELQLDIAYNKGDVDTAISLLNEYIAIKQASIDELKARLEIEIDETTKLNIEQQILNLQQDIDEKQIEIKFKVKEQELNNIPTIAEYVYQSALLEAEKAYEQELRLAGKNVAKKLLAEQKFNEAKREAYEKYINDVIRIENKASLIVQDFTQSILTSFFKMNDAIKATIDKLTEHFNAASQQQRDNYDEETRELTEAYKSRLITAEEYQRRMQAIQEKRAFAEREGEKETSKIRLGLAQGFYAVYEKNINAVDEALKRSASNIDRVIKEQQAKHASSAEMLSAITEQAMTDLKEISLTAVGASVSAFGAMLAAGVEFGEAFRKGLVGTLLKTAQQAILTYIPQIYGAFFAWLGPWGIPAATAAIALVYSALEVAKSAIGAKRGIVDIQGAGTETSDSILIRVSKGESVITASATKQNKALLEWMNRTGRPASEYFLQNYKQEQIIINYNQQLVLDELQAIKRELKQLNRAKAVLNRVDIGIDVNDREIIRRIDYNKEARLRRL